jgi:hypothetical protein
MTTATKIEYTAFLRTPHKRQEEINTSPAKRKIIRAGRRGGKTVGIAILALEQFLAGRRVLYAAPTIEQVDTFWREVKRGLAELLDAGVYTKNETLHTIERPGTENRIKAKTAWNADTMRGDYADLLIYDEWQLMNEGAWEEVGAPMLLDNNGDAVFIYTPPSLHSSGPRRAKDPLHASKMFKKYQNDTSGKWAVFHFSSKENPHISEEALADIVTDMSQLSYKQEILAEDVDESWKGLIYQSFRADSCIKPRMSIPKSWLIYSGHDFGGSNPAALFVAIDPATGLLWHWHEYLPGGGSTAEHVAHFKEITEGYTVVKSVGGSHQEDGWRGDYSAHGWPIQEPKRDMWKVKPRIERVRGLHDLDKVRVFEDMYNYLFEKSNFSWKIDENGEVTGDIDNEARFHLMSCEQYILSDFTPETAHGNKPQTRRSVR